MENQSKTYQPTGTWRHNHLSKIPGGSMVIVNYADYSVKYNNVKNTTAYINKIINTNTTVNIINIEVEGAGIVWEANS